MAKPLSEKKRTAILGAAIDAVAEAGLGAPTMKIARAAGVADGTLFVYFPTKGELLNQLYLHINADLRSAVDLGLDECVRVENWMRGFWDTYIEWGLRGPAKYKAARQLTASNILTAETRAAVRVIFAQFDQMIARGTHNGELRTLPDVFVGGLMDAIAGMVLELSEKTPSQTDAYRRFGWDSVWAAVVAT